MNNQLKIINFLGKNLGKSFTTLEASKLTKIPYATFYRELIRMHNLVITKRVGASKVISLHLEKDTLPSYLAISSEEEKVEFLKKQPVISKISSELQTKDIVLLFGSYAKGVQREDSDIDLLIINRTGKSTHSFSHYELLFKKKIHPICVTRTEFKKMLEESTENVGKQALQHHIVLRNPQEFWECVLQR